MPDPIAAILASRLGRLAGPAGFGARLAARFLPDNVGQTSFSVAATPEGIQSQAAVLLANRGELLDPGELHLDPDVVVAVVGAGRMALNPTVVTVTTHPSEAGVTIVSVRAVAKEGFVKQRAGEEVAAWVRARLTKSLGIAR